MPDWLMSPEAFREHIQSEERGNVERDVQSAAAMRQRWGGVVGLDDETVREEAARLDRLMRRRFESGKDNLDEFLSGVENASDDVLVRLLAATSPRADAAQALQAIRATLDRRISQRNISTMEKLEKSARFVGFVGLALALLGIFTKACGT